MDVRPELRRCGGCVDDSRVQRAGARGKQEVHDAARQVPGVYHGGAPAKLRDLRLRNALGRRRLALADVQRGREHGGPRAREVCDELRVAVEVAPEALKPLARRRTLVRCNLLPAPGGRQRAVERVREVRALATVHVVDCRPHALLLQRGGDGTWQVRQLDRAARCGLEEARAGVVAEVEGAVRGLRATPRSALELLHHERHGRLEIDSKVLTLLLVLPQLCDDGRRDEVRWELHGAQIFHGLVRVLRQREESPQGVARQRHERHAAHLAKAALVEVTEAVLKHAKCIGHVLQRHAVARD
mmetsp:Transcript_23580/g.74028  ORF Transcript_23580/g.74028 Transcript_23580/m.74028 type:complete len:300 (-) Transcript_23580:1973-2872(-)